MNKLRWVASFLEDAKTPEHGSIKRLGFLMACISLSASVVILSIAACSGADVSAALLAVTGPLAGLAGYGYVNGKKAERRPDDFPAKPE